MSSGLSVGTYSGPGEDGPAVAYRATVEGPPGPAGGLAGVHGSTSAASYGGPGTGSAYYPFGTGASRNFPADSDVGGMTAQNSQRHQDTGAGQHQSSFSVMEAPPPPRRHLVSSRYTGACDDNLSCAGIYQPCGGAQQHHAQMMAAAAAAGDPNFVCSVWTPESGYASYVIDQRTGATIARSGCW